MPDQLAFESPEWLNGLWALPIIVVLYLFRRRARRILVPFLPFWQRVFAEKRRRPSFLRALLSIVLQLLAAAAMLAALARPYREEVRAVPVKSVVIVDQSLGTRMHAGSATLAAAAAARARDVVARAGREGPVALAVLRGGLEPVAGDVAGVLEGLPPPAGIRSLDPIGDLRAASDPATRIFFVTPFEVAPPGLPGVTVIATEAAPSQNGGIRGVVHAAAEGEIVADVDPGGSSRRLQLLGPDGTELAAAAVPGTERVSVRLKLPTECPRDPTLALDPRDGFPDDDQAPLELPERAKLRVLIASDASTPALDSALVASSVMDQGASGRVPLAQLGAVLESFDVAIVVGAGSDLVLPPGRYVLIDAPVRGAPFQTRASAGEARATKKRQDVPWLKALDVEEWHVHRMTGIEAAPGFEVLVEGTRGPLVGRYDQGGVRAVVVSVRPDVGASTLPLLPAFPLLLRGALLDFGPRAAGGGAVVLRAGGRIVVTESEAAGMTSSDGAPRPLRLAPDGGGYQLPLESGRFSTGSRRIATAWLDHPAVPGPARGADDAWPAAPTARQRKSFVPALLLLVAGVLLAEWCSYHFGATD